MFVQDLRGLTDNFSQIFQETCQNLNLIYQGNVTGNVNRAYNQPCGTMANQRQVISILKDRLKLNADQKYCRKLQWELSAILSICIKVTPVYI